MPITMAVIGRPSPVETWETIGGTRFQSSTSPAMTPHTKPTGADHQEGRPGW